MADSGFFTLGLDNSQAKGAIEELVKGVGDYSVKINQATEAASEAQKKLAKATNSLKKAQEAYAKSADSSNAKSLKWHKTRVSNIQAEKKQLQGLKAELKNLLDTQTQMNAFAAQQGFEKQAKDLEYLKAQLRAFNREKQIELVTGKQLLAIHQMDAQLAASRTAEGKRQMQVHAALKETLKVEQRLAELRAKSDPQVLTKMQQAVTLQHQIRAAIESTTVAAKVQADAEIALAVARAKNSEEVIRLTRLTKEQEEAARKAAMTEEQLLKEKLQGWKKLRSQEEAFAKQNYRSMTGGMSEEYAKLLKMSERFYASNAKGSKALLAKFHQLAEEGKQAFRTGEGLGDYLAKMQVLIKRLDDAQKEFAQTEVGLKKVDKAARRAAKGVNTLNVAGGLARTTFDALGRHISVYAGGFIGITAGVYGTVRAIREIISVGSEFTGNMQRAGAVMGATSEQIAMMSASSRDLAATTVFTAAEASEALVQLGMAGLTVQESMTALEPTLRLASIGMLDFGRAADIVTNIMQGFQLGASQIPRIVDVLAQAVTSSNATVEQMGNAMSYAAPVAQSFGISLEAVAASMEVLHNAGIKASRAGTGMRRILLKLYSPTVAGAEALEALGVSMIDSSGKAKSFITGLQELANAIDEGKGSVTDLIDIVGVRAGPAFLQLVKASGSASNALVHFYEANLLARGAAKDMQKTIEDFIGADWDKLIAAAKEVGLKLFDMVKEDLRQGVQDLTNFLLELTRNDVLLEELADALTAVGKALGWLLAALAGGAIVKAVGAIATAFISLNTAAKTLFATIAGSALVSGLAGLMGAGKAAGEVDKITNSVDKSTKQLGKWSKLLKLAGAGILGFTRFLGPVGFAVSGLALLFADDLVDGVQSFIDTGAEILGLGDTISQVIESARELNEELASVTLPDLSAEGAATAVLSGTADKTKLIEEQLAKAGENLAISTKEVKVLEEQKSAYTELVAKSGLFKGELFQITQQLEQARAKQKEWRDEATMLGTVYLGVARKQQEAQRILAESHVAAMQKTIDQLKVQAGDALAQGDMEQFAMLGASVAQAAIGMNSWVTTARDAGAAVERMSAAMDATGKSVNAVTIDMMDMEGEATKILDVLGKTELKGMQDELVAMDAKLALITEANKMKKAGLKFDEQEEKYQRVWMFNAEQVKKYLEDRNKLESKIDARKGTQIKAIQRETKALTAQQLLRAKFEKAQATQIRKTLEPEKQLLEVQAQKAALYTQVIDLFDQLDKGEIQWATSKQLMTAAVNASIKVGKEELALKAKITKADEQAAKKLDDYAKSVSKAYSATEAYNEKILVLQKLMITMPQYTQDWVNEMDRLHREMVRSSMSEFQKKLEEFERSFEKLDEAAASWLDSLSSSMADFIVDGEADFSGFIDSIIRDLARMAAQDFIFNIGGVFSTSGGGGGGGGTPSATGGLGGLGDILGGLTGLFGGGAAAGSAAEMALFMTAGFESISASGIAATGALGSLTNGLGAFSNAIGTVLPFVGLAMTALSFLTGGDAPSFAFEGTGGLGDYQFHEIEDIEAAEAQKIKDVIDAFDQLLIAALDDAQVEAANYALQGRSPGLADIRDPWAVGKVVLSRYADVFWEIDSAMSEAFIEIIKSDVDSEEMLAQAAALLATWTQMSQMAEELNISMEGARNIAEAAGGVEAYSAAMGVFNSKFVDQGQKLIEYKEALREEFEKFGIKTIPESREAFASLAAGIDVTTEAGQILYGQLIALAPAMDAFYDAMEPLNDLMADIDNQLAELTLSDFANELRNISIWFDETTQAAKDLGASQEQLAKIERVAALRVAEAIKVIKVSIADLADQLYGTSSGSQDLQDIQDRIDLEQKLLDDQYDAAMDLYRQEMSRYEDSMRAVKSIKDFLASLTQGSLSPLTPEEKLSAAQAEYDRLLALAQAGDLDAAEALPGAATALLEAAFGMFASSERYSIMFEQVMSDLANVAGLLGNVSEPTEPAAPGESKEMSELLRQLVELQAQQVASERKALAEELVTKMLELGLATDQTLAEILKANNISMDQLADDLGLNLDVIDSTLINKLLALANDLGFDFSFLADSFDLDISTLGTTLAADLRANLPPDIALQLDTALQDIENATTATDLHAAMAALNTLVDNLPPDQQALLSPLFNNISGGTDTLIKGNTSGWMDDIWYTLTYRPDGHQWYLTYLDDIWGTLVLIEQHTRVSNPLAKGTPKILSDMPASLHAGEMVIDSASASVLRDYGINVSASNDEDYDSPVVLYEQDNSETVSELQALREEVVQLRAELADSHNKSVEQRDQLGGDTVEAITEASNKATVRRVYPGKVA